MQGVIAKLLGFNKTRRPIFLTEFRNLGVAAQAEDKRDANYAQFSKAIQLPSYFSLLEYASSVKDQGNEGSCVAHAAVLAYEMELRINKKIEFDGSEQQIYHDARILEGTFPQDSGLAPRDALKIMLHKGTAPEKLCPYNPFTKNDKIPRSATLFEKLYKIGSYKNSPTLQIAKEELYNFHPDIINIPVYQSFFKIQANVPMPKKSDSPVGYHEVCVIAFDDNHVNQDNSLGAFLFQNSWGTRWANFGRAWIPYSYFSDLLPGNSRTTIFYTLRLP